MNAFVPLRSFCLLAIIVVTAASSPASPAVFGPIFSQQASCKAHSVSPGSLVREPGDFLLRAKLASIEPSAGDADLLGVKLNLQFTFCNRSSRTVALSGEDFAISHIWVSSSLEDVKRGAQGLSAKITNILSGDEDIIEELANSLTIVEPDTSFTFRLQLALFMPRDKNKRIEGSVSRGEHYLKVRVDTWLRGQKELELLNRRLGDKIHLISEPLISEPLLIRLTEPVRKESRPFDPQINPNS